MNSGRLEAFSDGVQTKEILSTALYIIGIALSFFYPIVSVCVCIYFFVALMWLIPDKRIEKKLT